MEETPFFNLVRTHTITGLFASPLHGGNHDKVGCRLVGYDDSLNHATVRLLRRAPSTPPVVWMVGFHDPDGNNLLLMSDAPVAG